MMSTATVSESKTYICSVSENFACHNLSLKVKRFDLEPYTRTRSVRNARGEMEEREDVVFHYRAIDFPVSQVHYRDMDDDHGVLQIGARHDLTDEELKYLNEVEIPRYVVRWVGRYTPPKNKPDKRGVGPGGRFKSGRVIATKSSEGKLYHRYVPKPDDEPISKYVRVTPIGSTSSGFSSSASVADQQAALIEREADLRRREKALEARMKKLDAEVLAEAEADEDESLSTPEGRKTHMNQTRRKRRGK